MDKNVALYLGNPQRHALNRIHCEKKKTTNNAINNNSINSWHHIFFLILYYFMFIYRFLTVFRTEGTAILMAFEVLSKKIGSTSCLF